MLSGYGVVALQGYQLSMLGEEPDWSSLDVYQNTLTREEFEEALKTIYLPYGVGGEYYELYRDHVMIETNHDDPDATYRLEFAPESASREERRTSDLPARPGGAHPLSGLTIAIDPGHIGGAFSVMEERHFQIGDDPPVKEGDQALIVSKKLKNRLESLGAAAILLRTGNEPVTGKRPKHFREEAEAIVADREQEAGLFNFWKLRQLSSQYQARIEWRANLLFYRVSEIQARAELVKTIRPDFTVSVHFNVDPWGPDEQPRLSEDNHLHVLCHGTYMKTEVALDDVRLQMFHKLLSRNHETEIPLCLSVAHALAEQTGLRPFGYGGKNASKQGDSPYVWARNLLANRIYPGPVIFLEAYCLNSESVYRRIQMGDYEGLREFDGKLVSSLYAEYVEGVVQGLVDYYSPSR